MSKENESRKFIRKKYAHVDDRIGPSICSVLLVCFWFLALANNQLSVSQWRRDAPLFLPLEGSASSETCTLVPGSKDSGLDGPFSRGV